IVGVAAADESSRVMARTLLAATRVGQIDEHPLLEDQLYRLLEESRDREAAAKFKDLTLGQLKEFLLRDNAAAVHAVMPGLSSDVIGCVVKLMSNADLVAVGRKVFSALPG